MTQDPNQYMKNGMNYQGMKRTPVLSLHEKEALAQQLAERDAWLSDPETQAREAQRAARNAAHKAREDEKRAARVAAYKAQKAAEETE